MSELSAAPVSTISVTLSTELPADQIAVALKQSCRADVKAELVAHDPLRIPQLRIYEMTFASLEERDRLLIALRQREQGQKPAQRTVAAAPRMVRMEQRRRA